jgi:hypothetical protein
LTCSFVENTVHGAFGKAAKITVLCRRRLRPDRRARFCHNSATPRPVNANRWKE